jgi:hypothetical protein
MSVQLPAWVRELELSLVTHPQILLVGNVRDQYLLPQDDGPAVPLRLVDVIERVCRQRNYAALTMFDLVRDRLDTWPLGDQLPRLPESLTAMAVDDALSGRPRDGVDSDVDGLIQRRLRQVLRDVVEFRNAPIGLVFPYAHRLGSPRAELTGEAKLVMASVEALGHRATQAHGPNPVMPFNTVFWAADREEQLPSEFPLSSTALRIISVPPAPADQRLAAATHVARQVLLASVRTNPSDEDLVRPARNLLDSSHGMTNAEVLTVGRIAIDRDIPVGRLDEAARLYRVGVRDNPWASADIRDRIVAGERTLAGKADGEESFGVLGQDHAVRKAVEIFVRSAAGLTGAQSSSSPNRPRGVLFLAGPTGVGKTELAKGVARMIFGREAEPIRFDMSEFGQEHARERLIGAPPGFVGFDAGGELTNAVRANPMCVLLFDEIEKAHPRLFDFFLQILEDGRLTDGRGSTVYFTESVLIFTSNLGMSEPGPGGRPVSALSHKTPPDDVRRVLYESFRQFFDNQIGRPELRNRLGDSFIAMNFIAPEVVPALLDKALASVARRAASVHELTLKIDDPAYKVLHDRAVDNLDHGGRGVNNAVETLLINPLSRHVLMHAPAPGEVWTVQRIIPGETDCELEIDRCSG